MAEIGDVFIDTSAFLALFGVDMAWKIFTKMTGRISYTDCTCFAMMKRLHIHKVFTFDKHISKAGFTVVPSI